MWPIGITISKCKVSLSQLATLGSKKSEGDSELTRKCKKTYDSFLHLNAQRPPQSKRAVNEKPSRKKSRGYKDPTTGDLVENQPSERNNVFHKSEYAIGFGFDEVAVINAQDLRPKGPQKISCQETGLTNPEVLSPSAQCSEPSSICNRQWTLKVTIRFRGNAYSTLGQIHIRSFEKSSTVPITSYFPYICRAKT